MVAFSLSRGHLFVAMPNKKSAEIEDRLFAGMPAELKRLNKQARKERRQKDREAYAKANGIK